jgi:hypothetical protein
VGSNPTRSILSLEETTALNHAYFGKLSDRKSRNALSTSDREKLDDEVFDIPRLYIILLLYAVQPVRLYSIIMSILLHDYKQLTYAFQKLRGWRLKSTIARKIMRKLYWRVFSKLLSLY